MIEVEVKARISNLKEIKRRILKLGGKRIGLLRQLDVYFKMPHEKFSQHIGVLRVRRSNNICTLTYKGPRLGTEEAREEITVTISDFETMLEILHKLGLTELVKISKDREIYKVDHIKISLDTVKGLGNFIELELTVSKCEVSEIHTRLMQLLEKLGISKDAIEPLTYLELSLKQWEKMSPS